MERPDEAIDDIVGRLVPHPAPREGLEILDVERLATEREVEEVEIVAPAPRPHQLDEQSDPPRKVDAAIAQDIERALG